MESEVKEIRINGVDYIPKGSEGKEVVGSSPIASALSDNRTLTDKPSPH